MFVDPLTRLREAILTGTFLPNQRLVEADLAVFLETTRDKVRTAFAQLEHEGLIVRVPNRGARVRLVSPAEALEIVETRVALEGLLARHAASRARPADVAELQAIHAALAVCHREGDLMTYTSVNRRLHTKIAAIAAHATAARLLDLLQSQSVSFQFRSILRHGRVDDSMAEHATLIDAIARNAPDDAERAMREHLQHAVEALRATIANAQRASG